MNITKKRLKQIIKEELRVAVTEAEDTDIELEEKKAAYNAVADQLPEEHRMAVYEYIRVLEQKAEGS